MIQFFTKKILNVYEIEIFSQVSQTPTEGMKPLGEQQFLNLVKES